MELCLRSGCQKKCEACGRCAASGQRPAPSVLSKTLLLLCKLTLMHAQWMCFDACPLVACLPYSASRLAALTPNAKLIFMVRCSTPSNTLQHYRLQELQDLSCAGAAAQSSCRRVLRRGHGALSAQVKCKLAFHAP